MKTLQFSSATIITPEGRTEYTDKKTFIKAAKARGFAPDENGLLQGKIAARVGEEMAVVDVN